MYREMSLTLNFNNPIYLLPMGTPLYWRNESTGTLPSAIEQYIYWTAGQSSIKPSKTQFDLIKQYLRYWVNAPCWKGTSQLSQGLESINRVEDLEEWITECLEYGLDPL